MSDQIADILLFNGQSHGIDRISLFRKTRSKRDPRFEFTPRNSRATNDGDGYSSVWEIIDNCLMLRQIKAEALVEFNPPRMANWYCGTLELNHGKGTYHTMFLTVQPYQTVQLRFQHGKLVSQTIVDHTTEIDALRRKEEGIFGEPLEDDRVYLI